MIKNMYLVIFTLISFGATHSSYTMDQKTDLSPRKKIFTKIICSKLDEITEPIESKPIPLRKPIPAPEIKKTKSLPSIDNRKEYATINRYTLH